MYKSHTSVISTHFVDQVQIFFFFTHRIAVKVRLFFTTMTLSVGLARDSSVEGNLLTLSSQ